MTIYVWWELGYNEFCLPCSWNSRHACSDESCCYYARSGLPHDDAWIILLVANACLFSNRGYSCTSLHADLEIYSTPAWLRDIINLVWISNELNARWTFKHGISQLASLLETILTRRVERSVYCKFMVLLFLLAASYGRRGSACSQDSSSNMGHLWFVVQIGAKWSYKTIVAAWVHYHQQFNILELEE